jgi:hypothetical protein
MQHYWYLNNWWSGTWPFYLTYNEAGTTGNQGTVESGRFGMCTWDGDSTCTNGGADGVVHLDANHPRFLPPPDYPDGSTFVVVAPPAENDPNVAFCPSSGAYATVLEYSMVAPSPPSQQRASQTDPGPSSPPPSPPPYSIHILKHSSLDKSTCGEYPSFNVSDVVSSSECADAGLQVTSSQSFVDPTMQASIAHTWSFGYRCVVNRSNIVTWSNISDYNTDKKVICKSGRVDTTGFYYSNALRQSRTTFFKFYERALVNSSSQHIKYTDIGVFRHACTDVCAHDDGIESDVSFNGTLCGRMSVAAFETDYGIGC